MQLDDAPSENELGAAPDTVRKFKIAHGLLH